MSNRYSKQSVATLSMMLIMFTAAYADDYEDMSKQVRGLKNQFDE